MCFQLIIVWSIRGEIAIESEATSETNALSIFTHQRDVSSSLLPVFLITINNNTVRCCSGWRWRRLWGFSSTLDVTVYKLHFQWTTFDLINIKSKVRLPMHNIKLKLENELPHSSVDMAVQRCCRRRRGWNCISCLPHFHFVKSIDALPTSVLVKVNS